MFGIDIPLPVVALGSISGLTYGVLAIGIVLVYRSSRVINFAHTAIGALPAALLGIWVVKNGLPYWLMFPCAIAIGAAVGAIAEVVVVRRLKHAPRTMSVVASLGLAAFLTGVAAAVNTLITKGSQYPMPPHVPSFQIGALLVTPAYTAQLIGTPLIALGLAAFLRYSRSGVAIRASADNSEAAAASGMWPSRMSLLTWSIAGVIATYASIMQLPTQGFFFQSGGSTPIGPGLLVRALAVAAVARMSNFVVALLAGVVLGIVEQVTLWNTSAAGVVEFIVFGVLFLAVLVHTRRSTREQEIGSWLSVRPWPALPDQLTRLWAVRNLGRLGALGVLVLLPLVALGNNNSALTFTAVLSFTLVGLSVFIVTGLAGQLSLGQFALAGVGAILSYHLTRSGLDFVLAFLLTGVLTGVVAVAIGCTALRVRGLMLTVITLAFAVMCQVWLFEQPWAFGDGVTPGQPIYFNEALDTGRRYYLFAIPVFVIGIWLAWNVSRGGLRRAFVAVRDNEDGARAFSMRATGAKLQAFAVAGFLAGLGGALYAHSLPRLSAGSFTADIGITVVAMSAIGGLTLMPGAFFGALYLIALPRFVPLDSAETAASTFGWLILILYFPGGLAQLMAPVRNAVIDLIGRLYRVDARAARAEQHTPPEDGNLPPLPNTLHPGVAAERDPTSAPLLEVVELRKRFGGVRAVDGVSFDVRCGEILGLIGPNGAGKTTLFEMVSGFTKPDSGEVRFKGRTVTRLTPQARCRLGLVRSFQEARLFPTMTTLEVIMLSRERANPTRFLSSVLGLPTATRREREKRLWAEQVVAAMGLSAYASSTIASLSTGTRRMVELACVVSLQPDLILLDEPSAGIAQRESEALAAVILRLRDEMGMTVVVIEHDVPLIMKVSDRVLAMDTGHRIAIGTPPEVCSHPAVIASYLGANRTAISRSGDGDHDLALTEQALP